MSKNCNCTGSHRGENTLELGCCDKWITLEEAAKTDKCPECNKEIRIFDTVDNAKRNGE